MTKSESKIILERDLNCLKQNKALPDSIESMEIAINALEKQIAKKPKSITPVEDSMYVKCPTCKLTTVLYHGCIMDYCKNCGQKLDWSDKE